MIHTQTLLLSYIFISKPLAYSIVFTGMMIEGDIFLFTTAFLASAGFFDIGDVFFIALSGAFIGDIVWFWLGRRFMNSSALLKRWTDRIASPFDGHIRERPFRTIFLSKFAYGLHRFLLARAGAFGMHIFEFIRLDAVAILLWIGVIGGLGYFSGTSVQLIRHYLKFTEVAVGVAIFAFIVFEYFTRRLTRKRL
jgi:membrane protein DedA with SNARE-associated domain